MKNQRSKRFLVLSLSLGLLFAGGATRVLAETPDPANQSAETENVVRMDALVGPLNTAIDLFKQAYKEAELTKIEVELKDKKYYEIKLTGQDGKYEYEFEYETKNETVTDREVDDDDDMERVLNLEELLGVDEINQIVYEEVGFWPANEWKLEWDDDDDDGDDDDDESEEAGVYWKVKVDQPELHREIELKIDALTGKIVSIKKDD